MDHPLEKLTKDYLNQKNVSKATKKSYRIAFKHYTSYLLDKKITYAKTSDIIKYKAYRRQIGDSPTWIYIQMSALKGLYTYLANHQKRLNLDKAYGYNIMVPIQNKQDKYQIKKHILSPGQARDLIIKTKDRSYIWDYRDHAIIYLMLVSGMRRFEIINAKRRDYRIIEGIPLIYLGSTHKNKDRSFIKLSKGAMRALNDYLVLRDDDNPYLFRSHKYARKNGQLSKTFFRQMFKRVLKKASLDQEKITPNCLRQTAGIFNLMRGGSMSQTYGLLRHVHIESTLAYKSYLDRINDQTEEALESFILSEEAFDFYDYLRAFFDD